MNYTEFYKYLKGSRVAFIGAGVSNKPLIEKFVQSGAVVTLCDKKTSAELGDVAPYLEQLGVKLSLGPTYLSGLKNQHIIVRTPGFEYFTPELQQAKRDGAFITSEIELFFDACPCKIYAVTGSDGKTTTTTLIAKMLEHAGRKVHLGGNIGRPLFPIIDEVQPQDIAVVELSSFQLISMTKSPHVAVVTNVTPNHLDHHKDMKEYIDAKRNILLHQTKADKAVLGYDNAISRDMKKDVRGSTFYFSAKKAMSNCAFLNKKGFICVKAGGETEELFSKDEIKLPGAHNVENVLCAAMAVYGDVPAASIKAVATNFMGVEHRIEFVRSVNGVKYYNDSIASSPTRTIAGLNSFSQKIILIAGGYDKKVPFEPLAPEILKNVKQLILMGQTADVIEKTVRAAKGFEKSGIIIERAQNMQQAVEIAAAGAVSGDIVSLSPACASFDAYENFEKRGEHFKRIVNAL